MNVRGFPFSPLSFAALRWDGRGRQRRRLRRLPDWMDLHGPMRMEDPFTSWNHSGASAVPGASTSHQINLQNWLLESMYSHLVRDTLKVEARTKIFDPHFRPLVCQLPFTGIINTLQRACGWKWFHMGAFGGCAPLCGLCSLSFPRPRCLMWLRHRCWVTTSTGGQTGLSCSLPEDRITGLLSFLDSDGASLSLAPWNGLATPARM